MLFESKPLVLVIAGAAIPPTLEAASTIGMVGSGGLEFLGDMGILWAVEFAAASVGSLVGGVAGVAANLFIER